MQHNYKAEWKVKHTPPRLDFFYILMYAHRTKYTIQPSDYDSNKVESEKHREVEEKMSVFFKGCTLNTFSALTSDRVVTPQYKQNIQENEFQEEGTSEKKLLVDNHPLQ